MKIFVDEQEAPGEAATLAAALDTGRDLAERRGRVVIEVWADGRRVGDDELSEPPTDSPYAEEVRLVTASPEALVSSTLFDAADALEQIKATQTAAARHMQTGATKEAMEAFASALSVWEAVRRAVGEGCALVGRTPGDLLGEEGEDEGRALAEASQALAENLTTLRDFTQAEDWSSAADVLEFDLAERADAWVDILRRLASGVRNEGASA